MAAGRSRISSGRACGLAAACILSILATIVAGQQTSERHVILITLDGVRTQEIFGGLDLEILRSTMKKNERAENTRTYGQFWAPTAEQRRAKLMPFFWGEWMTSHGSIIGNRQRDSQFGVRNVYRSSYPGYAEILTGEPHDADIRENVKRRYRFPTILEVLQRRLSLPGPQVAAFSSWEVSRWVVSSRDGGFVVNAGYQPITNSSESDALRWSREQFEVRSPWDSLRHDMFTFRLALSHLRVARPRVLYLALGETDYWAHAGQYDRVLDALASTDVWFRELWEFLQSDAEYRDNTTILVTVDHGRGRGATDWSAHGQSVKGAEETWLAAVGPDWPRRGEWTGLAATADQVAATLARAAGVDLREDIPGAGAPIGALWEPSPPDRPAGDPPPER